MKSKKRHMLKNILKLIICLIVPMLVGGISGVATVAGIKDWYVHLNKPFFNPPNYLFGPVWSILYLLMGVSLFMILQSKSITKKKAISIFFVQLFLNFWWSFLFFKFQLLGISLIEIVLMWLSILWMIIEFKKINKTAAYLQIPYLAWVTFASLLNLAIWYLN
jgi:tryptophan-rich sensory protein